MNFTDYTNRLWSQTWPTTSLAPPVLADVQGKPTGLTIKFDILVSFMPTIFAELEKPGGQYEIKDPGKTTFYPQFKAKMLDQSSDYFLTFNNYINGFYSEKPFNIIDIFAKFFFNFVKATPRSFIIAKPILLEKLTENGYNGVLDYLLDNPDSFPGHDFNNLIKSEVINNSKTGTAINPLVVAELTSQIKTLLANQPAQLDLDDITELNDYLTNLDFSSASALEIGGVYRELVANINGDNPTSLSVDATSYQQALTTYLDPFVNTNDGTSKLRNFINVSVFKHIEKLILSKIATEGTKEQADKLIANKNFATLAAEFAPDLGKLLSDNGIFDDPSLLMVQNITLEPIPNPGGGNKEYNLDFNIRYGKVTYGDPALIGPEKPIKITEKVSLIVDAQSRLNKFLENVTWNTSNLFSPKITERELIEWFGNFSSRQDLIDQRDKGQFLISRSDIEKMISNPSLGFPSFSDLKRNGNHIEIEILGEIKSDTIDGVFGSLQISINIKEVPDAGQDPIAEESINIYPSKPIYEISYLLFKKVNEENSSIDKNLQFTSSFWLEEVLDSKYNAILNIVDVAAVLARTNIEKWRMDIASAVSVMNQYRDDFEILQEAFIEDGQIVVVFKIIDQLTNLEYSKRILVQFNEMNNINTIPQGEYKKEGGYANLATGHLKQNIFPAPNDIQVPPKIGDQIDPATFLVTDEAGNYVELQTILDVLNDQYDFPVLIISDVYLNADGDLGVKITFGTDYYYLNQPSGSNKVEFRQEIFVSLKYDYVSPDQVEKAKQEIKDELPPKYKDDKIINDIIEGGFDVLKDGDGNYRDNISQQELDNVATNVRILIAEYLNSDNTLKDIKEIFGGQIPKHIEEYLNDPNGLNVIQDILNRRSELSDEKIREILNNAALFANLTKLNNKVLTDIIVSYIKFASNAKYVYFGLAILLAGIGVGSIFATQKQLSINTTARKISSKIRKNNYILLVTIFIAIITIGASAAMTLIFFIKEGGF